MDLGSSNENCEKQTNSMYTFKVEQRDVADKWNWGVFENVDLIMRSLVI